MACSDFCSNIPINALDLLHVHGAEELRLEFKKQWHGQKESGPRGTFWQVLHTICAFANDLRNVNGGYIVIGVEEKKLGKLSADGLFGVPYSDIDRIQREIAGGCKAYIDPAYYPIISPQVVELEGEKKMVLVIWASASRNGPHTCKETEKGINRPFYIRRGSATLKASSDEQRQLLSLRSCSNIPFDDQIAQDTEYCKQLSEEDIDFNLVREYLKAIHSRLSKEDDQEKIRIYQSLKLVNAIGEKRVDKRLVSIYVPKNVALLFFHPTPHKFFKGAKIGITVHNSNDVVTNAVELTGPIDKQIEQSLSWILGITNESYPAQALREAVTNAFYHRSYEHCSNNPIKIKILPHCIDIFSFPGPDPGLEMEHFSEGKTVPCVPSRNVRIGELLKQLKLAEGYCTGVKTMYKTMKENGNPQLSFHFRPSYFHVHLRSKHNVSSIPREFQCGDDNNGDADDNGNADDDHDVDHHHHHDHDRHDLGDEHPLIDNWQSLTYGIQEQDHRQSLVEHGTEQLIQPLIHRHSQFPILGIQEQYHEHHFEQNPEYFDYTPLNNNTLGLSKYIPEKL